MILNETKLKGVFSIYPEKISDERGFFARVWSLHEFAQKGLINTIVESNVSFNDTRGTLRGMHYQEKPFAQAKVVRCTRGSIFDVVIDLRDGSPTFKQWIAVELSEFNHISLYIPAGLAHGFQTLEDNSEVFYQMSEVYAPDYARGVRWNDPAFSIKWPPAERKINHRDQTYPDFAL
jgi:dTDP-4-dehydrorhamnose 3,5-epimerase